MIIENAISDLLEYCKGMNFFKVGYYKPKKIRLFASLESSLSIRSAMYFEEKSEIKSIDIAEMNHGWVSWQFCNYGICFADTGLCYMPKDIKELKRDYLIAKLSQIKQ